MQSHRSLEQHGRLQSKSLAAETGVRKNGHKMFDEMPKPNFDLKSQRTLLVTVTNTVYPITETVLHELFDSFGKVEMIYVLPAKKEFRALLTYECTRSVNMAVSALNGQNIYDGCCKLHIQYCNELISEPKSERTLFVTVSNTVYPISESVLHEVFDSYGKLEMIYVLPAKKEFQALLRYECAWSANMALSALNGRYIYDGCCKLHIQYCNELISEPETVKRAEREHTISVFQVVDKTPMEKIYCISCISRETVINTKDRCLVMLKEVDSGVFDKVLSKSTEISSESSEDDEQLVNEFKNFGIEPAEVLVKSDIKTSMVGISTEGILFWNQTRQQWVGSKRSQKPVKAQYPKLSSYATYESLLGTNKSLPQPIPLSEMVDFLVDVWEQEGLYTTSKDHTICEWWQCRNYLSPSC